MAPPRTRTPTLSDANRAYVRLIEALGLNHAEASRFLSSNYRTSRRWAEGESQPAPELLMLLSVMVALDLTPDRVREIAGLPAVAFRDRRYRKPEPAPPKPRAKPRAPAKPAKTPAKNARAPLHCRAICPIVRHADPSASTTTEGQQT